MVDILRKELSMDFETAVEHVQQKVEEAGFKVIAVKPIHQVVEMNLGEKIDKYTIILACGPRFAKMALEVSKDVGLLFPCSFVVYEDEGKVLVAHSSIMKMAPELGFASAEGMAPVIEETGKAVRSAWEVI